jgi:hypothetical protein
MWLVSTTPRRFTPGKDPVSIVQEAGWAPGPVWTCAKNLASTGIRSPACPARGQSLYRLNYPAHVEFHKWLLIVFKHSDCPRCCSKIPRNYPIMPRKKEISEHRPMRSFKSFIHVNSSTFCALPTIRRNHPQLDTLCECHTDLLWRGPNGSSVGQTRRIVEI